MPKPIRHKGAETVTRHPDIFEISRKLIARAETLGIPEPRTPITIAIDLHAADQVGCDLDALLEFPDFDFMHDWTGIARHTDRKQIGAGFTDCFLPRCYRKTQ